MSYSKQVASLVRVSSGDHQDLRQDEALGDIRRKPPPPEPRLPHPANQHQDGATEVSDPEEPHGIKITAVPDQEAVRPSNPWQQVRLAVTGDVDVRPLLLC